MDITDFTKKLYDTYGEKYQKSRENKVTIRLYNEFIEVPAMIEAVGDVKGKKLLDIGCGAGVHIKYYLKKGAECFGVDLSETMINLAKDNCPSAKFVVGNMTELPYKDSSFDIVTASLSIGYVGDLHPVFKEVCRVLKKGGIFYYSNESVVAYTREKYEDKNYKIKGVGEFIDKKTGKRIILGKGWDEGLVEWELLPGVFVKTYIKTIRSQLQELVNSGFELIDFIDCKPTPDLKSYNNSEYALYSKYPRFNIFVVRKK